MSNKELIKTARCLADNTHDSDLVCMTLARNIYQLCDALEEHEPKPVIRKGEVYAHKGGESWPWAYAVADCEKQVQTKINSMGGLIRKLTADEMPLPEEN